MRAKKMVKNQADSATANEVETMVGDTPTAAQEGEGLGSNVTKLNRGRPFEPGQSGNPAGRPRGALNRATLFAQAMISEKTPEIIAAALERAIEQKDVQMLRWLMARIVPPAKDDYVSIRLPVIENPADAHKAYKCVVEAVGAGEITPSQAMRLADIIERAKSFAESSKIDLMFG